MSSNTISQNIAKHFREVITGGNWTFSNVKDHLSDITLEEASSHIYGCNTIAMLVFHMNYYVDAVLRVFEGNPLEAHDQFSFAHPPLNSDADWNTLREKTFTDAARLAQYIENLDDVKLWDNIDDEKYGSYYRNLHGIIEHYHYHLGQLVLIKKIIRQQNSQTETSN